MVRPVFRSRFQRATFRVVAAAGLAFSTIAAARPQHVAPQPWIATWAAPEVAPAYDVSHTGFSDQTLRMRLHATVGGSSVRIRLANTFGAQPLAIERVTIARANGVSGPALDPATLHTVAFDSEPTVLVPMGTSVASDPVALRIEPFGDAIVSLYLRAPTGPATWHRDARATSWISSAGDRTNDADAAHFATTNTGWYFLSEIDVGNAAPLGAIAVFGDSLSEGAVSTADMNHRYSDYLAQRMLTDGGAPYAVVQAALGGNRLLLDGDNTYGQNALARFDRDALDLAGVRAAIVFEGINDICIDPGERDPAAIVGALRQLIDRAHTAGKAIAISTIGPFANTRYWTPAREQVRSAVNAWIRHDGGGADLRFDFDAALDDPANPLAIRPAYDGGDHLHPNDAGYAAIAASIDVGALRSAIARAALPRPYTARR